MQLFSFCQSEVLAPGTGQSFSPRVCALYLQDFLGVIESPAPNFFEAGLTRGAFSPERFRGDPPRLTVNRFPVYCYWLSQVISVFTEFAMKQALCAS